MAADREGSGTPDQVRGDEGVSTTLDTNGVLGRVFINADQYFEDVPEVAWNFHIGGYQPAQKWLKDRRGRVLSFEDIGHYQKIVKILIETDPRREVFWSAFDETVDPVAPREPLISPNASD